MKLKLGIKLGYASAALGDACTYTFIGTFLMFFLTTVAGINPVTAGTIAAVGAIWDALWSPVVGFISDKTTSKHGRRRPYLFLAAFPLAVATCVLFTSIDAGYSFKVVYYALMVIIFWAAFGTFFVPYMALGAEITDDYDERTVLRSYAYFFNLIGMVVGMVFPTVMVDYLVNSGRTDAAAWQGTAFFVGAAAFLSILITFAATKGRDHHKQTQTPAVTRENSEIPKKKGAKGISAIAREYWQVIKLRPTRFLIGASIFYLIANTMNSADRMYFFTYNMGFSGKTVTGIMLFITAIGAIFVPIILGVSKWLDKRSMFILGMTISAAGVALMRFIGIESLTGVVIFALVFGCGNTCYWQLLPSMIYDVCEVDELVSGQRREGIVISLQSLSEAVASATSMQILGIILEFSGFDGEAASQTPLAQLWVENAFSIIPACFMVLTIIMIIKYPVTKLRFQEVLVALEKKRKGETIDLQQFKSLL